MPEHRPYARDPAAPPSVTQVLDSLSKSGLSWGAAKETAEFAVHHQGSWMDLPPRDAVTRLYRHHRGIWDHRALIGSALHRVNAEWCQGNTVKLLDIIQELRQDSPLWRGMPEAELYAELLPMADGLAKFWLKAEPQPLSWEQVVRYTPGPLDYGYGTGLAYIGTLDWRVKMNGQNLLLDLKTTGKVKPGSAKYWDVWRLQLAAYRYANEAVIYRDGEERGSFELPGVDGCAVVHLYRDGHVELNPVQAGPAEHEVFLALLRVYNWRKSAGQGMGDMDLAPMLGVPT